MKPETPYLYNFRRIKKESPKMKNFLRAFALSLVVTGAFASAHMAKSTQGAVVSPTKVSSMPPPLCDYNAPGACGFGGPQGN